MIRFVIKLYILLLIIDSIMSFFPQLMKHEWRRKMKRLCDYSLDPVRSRLPTHLPFDVSPLVVIFFLLLFIEIFTYLW